VTYPKGQADKGGATHLWEQAKKEGGERTSTDLRNIMGALLHANVDDAYLCNSERKKQRDGESDRATNYSAGELARGWSKGRRRVGGVEKEQHTKKDGGKKHVTSTRRQIGKMVTGLRKKVLEKALPTLEKKRGSKKKFRKQKG